MLILPGRAGIAQCICCAEAVSTGNLTAMRPSLIWFVLAFGWGLDSVLALFHRNRMQAALTAFFSACFLVVALLYRKRERKYAHVAKIPE